MDSLETLNVKLLKLITELEYNGLPDDQKHQESGEVFGVTMFDYYAILAERPPGRGSDFEYNDEVLDKISLPKRNDESDAFGPPIQPTITFKKDIAEYNSSGGRNSPFTTVTANANKTIQRKEGIEGGSAKDQTGLGANTADSADANAANEVENASKPVPNSISPKGFATANEIKENYGSGLTVSS